MDQKDQDSGNGQRYPMNWDPPKEGWLKCNVDAAFNNHRGTTNKGWCVRDNLGSFIIEGVAWDPRILTVIKSEALPLKEANQ
ncbi:unnamed protein product [Lathyrus sativus]|nr:unnamed protein product [Lathyrus sativus]